MPDAVDLATFIESGVTMLGATADEYLKPEVFRAWGASLQDDGSIRALISADAEQTLAHLRPGTRMCLVFSDPRTFRSVQVKGRAVGGAEPPGSEDAERMRAYGDVLADVTSRRGVPAALVERTRPLAVVAVTMEVEELFDQTPGPGAGARVEQVS